MYPKVFVKISALFIQIDWACNSKKYTEYFEYVASLTSPTEETNKNEDGTSEIISKYRGNAWKYNYLASVPFWVVRFPAKLFLFLLKTDNSLHQRQSDRVVKMAFLLNTSIASQLRSHSQQSKYAHSFAGRGYHVELGAREKALLADDPFLKKYKSTKKSVTRLKKFGDVLTIVVVAGCCYEIYVRAVMREEARKQAKDAQSA